MLHTNMKLQLTWSQREVWDDGGRHLPRVGSPMRRTNWDVSEYDLYCFLFICTVSASMPLCVPDLWLSSWDCLSWILLMLISLLFISFSLSLSQNCSKTVFTYFVSIICIASHVSFLSVRLLFFLHILSSVQLKIYFDLLYLHIFARRIFLLLLVSQFHFTFR